MNSALQYERFDMPHMYIGPILKIYGLLPRRQMAAILDWHRNLSKLHQGVFKIILSIWYYKIINQHKNTFPMMYYTTILG